MTCPRCGHDNPAARKFCGECGAALAARCPACGVAATPGQKFCGECGHALAPRLPADGATRFASPLSYTPKHLAERILTSRGALEGERKHLTVLFADLKGSTALLADRDPEDARRLLDPVIERMMAAVHRYEGTVNQVMGDGIMALFGAPIAHEDHAVRACYAALGMQADVARYADELQRDGHAPVSIRVGINSGEVVVRSIGSDLHMDYTAVGATTHLAARMEQLARPGSTLIAPATLRLVEGWVEVRPLGPVAIKGLDAPVDAFELAGVGVARSRLQAAAGRGLSRFVGRTTEVERLGDALARAGAGHGQVVAGVGEPGVGKSRLFHEFVHSHCAHGWLVLESSSVSYGRTTPYLSVVDFLKGYFRVQDRDEPREIRERITGKLLALDERLESTLPAFLGLFDLAVEDDEWRRLEPLRRRARTLEAIKGLVLRESQRQPLCLIFEDLHWLDAESQAVLDAIVDILPAARILLLVNYRPEYRHEWGGRTWYSQLRLDPLPEATVDELLTALIGASPGLGPLRVRLTGQAEGNPLFLEECVRAFVETGVLAGDRGAYQLTRPLAAIGLPPSVQAIIAARIDRLDPADKHVLQSAAVIGKDVPVRLLQAIQDDGDDVAGALARLQAAEFLYETTVYPDAEYTFKHAVTHDVAYGSLLAERRRTQHSRVVDAIIAVHAERLGEHVERLAHHARLAERWPEAVGYLREAGLKALDRSAYRPAIAYFEQAIEALSHLAERRDTLELAIDLRFELRRALTGVNDAPRILERLAEAEPIARTLGDRRRLGLIFSSRANITTISGAPERAVAPGIEAVRIASELDDLSLHLIANVALAQALNGVGRLHESIELMRWNLAHVPPERERETLGLAGLHLVNVANALVSALSELGEFDEALARARGAVTLAERTDNTYSHLVAAASLAVALLRRGDFGDALHVTERMRRTSEATGIVISAVRVLPAAALAMNGHAAGLELLEEVFASDAKTGQLWVRTVRFVIDGRLAFERWRDALQLADEWLPQARERGLRSSEAWLHCQAAEALRRGGDRSGDAANRYRAAIELGEELGMRPLVARAALGLGRALAAAGARAGAREALTRAVTMLRDMDMRRWLTEAERALAALDG